MRNTITLILFFALYACSDRTNQAGNPDETQKNDTIIAKASQANNPDETQKNDTIIAKASQANNPDETQKNDTIITKANELSGLNDFQLFWNDFRKAVIDNDTIKLSNLTNFPLNSHGVFDDDPQIKIGVDRFVYFFNICLNEQTGMTTDNETNLDFIRRTERLENDKYVTIRDNWCRISNMEFKKINGIWKLVRIYFDTAEY